MKTTTPLKALILHNLFCGAAIVAFSMTGIWNIFWVKDAAIGFVLILAVLHNISRLFILVKNYFFWFIPILVFASLISSANYFLQLASFRQIVVPFVLLTIGYSLVSNRKQLYELARFTIIALLLIVLFGFFERSTLLWSYIDISGFFLSKNIPVFGYGYPVFWIEPISILGHRTFYDGIPRMVSLILDPINLGHLLVFGIALVAYEWKEFFSFKCASLILLILLAGLVLTLSKGAYLHFFISLIVLNGKIRFSIKLLAAAMAAPLIYLYITQHAGFSAHLKGFVGVFEYLSIFGSGLGSFGNYSAMYSDASDVTVGDSYWAAIIGQLGIVGFFAWLAIFFKVCKKIGFKHYISSLLTGQVLVSALSENTFNLMSVFLIMIFAGAYLRLNSQRSFESAYGDRSSV